MALITDSTFRPLESYVKVRLQQGVPILDADWNEQDDVRQFELRAYLKWFVQDGVPEGNDGFRIDGDGTPDDFIIRRGGQDPPAGADEATQALRHVGRCLVDGLDVMISKDWRYITQPLHTSHAGAAAMAAKLHTTVIPTLNPPGDGPLLVYLDVWEVTVSPDDEPKLVLPGLGIETCARVQRHWAVRVRKGSALPVPGQEDFLAGHSTLELAVIRLRSRREVLAADVADRRHRRLLVPPAHLIEDTLGVAPDSYRRGQARPPISLREAVNALLAGEVPGSAEMKIAPAPGTDVARRAYVADALGGVVAIWQSNRNGNVNQIYASRLDTRDLAAGFSAAVALTGSGEHLAPTIVALPDGDLVVAYQTGPAGSPNTDIVMKRAGFAGLAAAVETKVAATASQSDEKPLAILLGDAVVFLSYLRAGTPASSGWAYRRYRIADGSFIDPSPQLLRSSAAPTTDLQAAPAPEGNTVWAAYVDGGNVKALAFQPADGGIGLETSAVAPGARDLFVLADSMTAATVLWTQDGAPGPQLMQMQCVEGVWRPAESLAGIQGETEPVAAVDTLDRLWLFTATGTELVMRTQQVQTGEFTAPRVVARVPRRTFATPVLNPKILNPFPIFVSGQGIWLFWASGAQNDFDLSAKRLITSL